jgi:hypothetical protein
MATTSRRLDTMLAPSEWIRDVRPGLPRDEWLDGQGRTVLGLLTGVAVGSAMWIVALAVILYLRVF